MRTPPDDVTEPVIEPSDNPTAELTEGQDINDRLSAEDDVADSLEDVSVHAFDDMPQDGPLNFNDGTDMAHPRGNTSRAGGTWEAEGGDLKPPSELLSDTNGPSDPEGKRQR